MSSRQTLLLFTVVIVCAGVAYAAVNRRNKPQYIKADVALQAMTPLTVDAGHRVVSNGQGEDIFATFRFINKGAEPLKIDQVKTTCTCASVDFNSKEVEPGNELIATMKLETFATGDRNASAIFRTNYGQTIQCRVRLTVASACRYDIVKIHTHPIANEDNERLVELKLVAVGKTCVDNALPVIRGARNLNIRKWQSVIDNSGNKTNLHRMSLQFQIPGSSFGVYITLPDKPEPDWLSLPPA